MRGNEENECFACREELSSCCVLILLNLGCTLAKRKKIAEYIWSQRVDQQGTGSVKGERLNNKNVIRPERGCIDGCIVWFALGGKFNYVYSFMKTLY